MIAVLETYHPERGHIEYSPTVLMVAACSLRTLRIKKLLESNGCSVGLIAPRAEVLSNISENYFDVMILVLGANDAETGDISPELKAYADLRQLPLVVLTSQPDRMLPDRLNQEEVYCISNEEASRANLLHLIEQICYLARRYP